MQRYGTINAQVALGALWGVALLLACLATAHADTLQVPQQYPDIQSAVDAAKDGDVVEVDASQGPYQGPIEVTKAIQLRSVNGRAEIDLVPAKPSEIAVLLHGSAQLEGFLILVEATGGGFPAMGVRVLNGSGARVLDNWIDGRDSRTVGIWLQASQGVLIQANRVQSTLDGVNLIASQGNRLEDNLIQATNAINLFGSAENVIQSNEVTLQTLGIRLLDAAENTISRNHIVHTAGLEDSIGLLVIQDSRANQLMDNTIEGPYTGIELAQTVGNAVLDNQIAGTTQGIHLVSAPDHTLSQNRVERCETAIWIERGSDRTTVRDNALSQAETAVLLESSSTLTLQNNALSDITAMGVQGNGPLSALDLTGNAVSLAAAKASGVRLEDVSDSSISDNTVSMAQETLQGEQGLVFVALSNSKVSGNSVDRLDTGIVLRNSGGNKLEGNAISTGQRDGILLENSRENTLARNHVQGFAIAGVSLLGGSNGNKLAANDLSDNGFGIRLTDADDNVLESNKPSGNAGGISLVNSHTATLKENVVTENGEGISLKSSEGATLAANKIADNDVGLSAGDLSGLTVMQNTFERNLVLHVLLRNVTAFSLTENRTSDGDAGFVLVASREGRVEKNTFGGLATALRVDDSVELDVERNQFLGNDVAVLFDQEGGPCCDENPDAIRLTRNSFGFNRVGVWITERSPLAAHSRLRDNSFSGNGEFAVLNESDSAVDAAQNWWGHASGPSGAGSGQGDAVSTGVVFDAWLLQPPDSDGSAT